MCVNIFLARTFEEIATLQNLLAFFNTPWSHSQANLAAVLQIRIEGGRKAMPFDKLFAVVFLKVVFLIASTSYY